MLLPPLLVWLVVNMLLPPLLLWCISATKVLEMAAAVAEAARCREAAAQAAAQRDADARQRGLARIAAAPAASSSAFKAPSRDQVSVFGGYIINC
jgi:hypothetical protein